MRHDSRGQRLEDGFTIVELMIATAVLSIILVLVTVVMVNIGNLYYKGINQARVQDGVRSVVDDISRQLQLSNGFTTGSASYGGLAVKAYCIGTTRYSYVQGTQIGTGSEANGAARLPHVLWRDTNSSGACAPLDLRQDNPSGGVSGSSNGTELMPPRSRLAYFNINGTSPYSVQVEIAYGDYDLLNATTGSPSSLVRCLGSTGNQFCSTAALNTVVVRRL